MARKKNSPKSVEVESYKHSESKRKNIPLAKIAAEGKIPKTPKATYAYSAHLPPELRFDADGRADQIWRVVAKAVARQALTDKETDLLRRLGEHAQQPWLEWAGKKEEHDRRWLQVDPVALHIHERVSTQAILKVAAREDVQRSLFADPQQEYNEAIQFYRHDVDWANRLILGDSLQVMSSLARREDLAGKVQMIYIDPPYGIKFASNFQPEVGRRDVKDKEQDLTREPEMVRAYRDTWHLGIHSYLSYLRDRLIVARELLADTGSIFVQIGDENVHRVRTVLDEVFGCDNFVSQITFYTTNAKATNLIGSMTDHILWYARQLERCKYHQIYTQKGLREGGGWAHNSAETPEGTRIRPGVEEIKRRIADGENLRPYSLSSLGSQGATSNPENDWFVFEGRRFHPGTGHHWKTTVPGMYKLAGAGRIEASENSIRYVRFLDDFSVQPVTSAWDDTTQAGYADKKAYVVQTLPCVVERCMLMTTDPGDLVLDPTCGSGTTAYVAEQWGRRWITIDTSRVAIAIARQRLLTAKYSMFELRPLVAGDTARNPKGTWLRESGDNRGEPRTFRCKTLPHVTLKSNAQNTNLDPIFAKHEPLLEAALMRVNRALEKVTDAIRESMCRKLAEKTVSDGLSSLTDADERRWLLPKTKAEMTADAFDRAFRRAGKKVPTPKQIKAISDCIPQRADAGESSVPTNGNGWEHWQVPFDTDPDWPKELQDAVKAYRAAWRAKMDEVNACIAANAEQEELVDQPEIVRGVVRVSGPFTVEGVRPEELSLGEDGEIFDPTPNEFEGAADQGTEAAQNASAYLTRMIQLLRQDGVTFPNNQHRTFGRIEPLYDTSESLHAEGIWSDGDASAPCNVAVAFGPQCGPVTAEQVEDLVRASRRYDELVVAGFSFDGAAQEIIQQSQNPRLKIHMAHIRPDVSPGMDGLLKDTPNSQLFTVFGQPEIEVRAAPGGQGQLEVELLGVDIYSPLTGEVRSERGSKVASWFLDSDYDGRCFCTTQAFFPNQDAWDKIAKALNSLASPEAFEALKGTVSLPFPPGKHRRIAVKVIDPRGNEVMAIRSLKGEI